MQLEPPGVKLDFPPRSLRDRQQLRVAERIRVEQGQDADGFARGIQLLRHLPGDHAAKGHPAQIVRPVRLNGLNFTDVMRGHHFDAGRWRRLSIQPLRLKSVHWEVVAHVMSQVPHVQHIPSQPVNDEIGGACSARLNGHQ